MRDLWIRKRFVDMWSIPHFLFGVLCAYLPIFFNITNILSLFIMIVVALLWEVYEKLINVKEAIGNIFSDVLFPVAGFFLTSKIFTVWNPERQEFIVSFLAVLILYSFTNISGWLAFKHRKREFIN